MSKTQHPTYYTACSVCGQWGLQPLDHTGPQGNTTSWWTCGTCGQTTVSVGSRDANGYYDPPLPLEAADGR